MIKSHLLRRVFYHCWEWEDYKAGMYKGKKQGKEFFDKTESLFLDLQNLRIAMKEVSIKWPVSAEHNLTNNNRNRRAWLGRSSNSFAHGATENTTRIVWRRLTEEQKARANEVAESVINEWEMEYFKGKDA